MTIVDHDAAIDRDAGVLGERDIGPDARRENHRIGVQRAPIGQFDAFDMRLPMNTRGVRLKQNLDALALDQRFQQRRGRRIELTFHQPVHQVNQGDARTGLGKAIGGFEAEQSAADHDDASLLRGQCQQQIDIAAVAKGVHAGKFGAGHIQPQRRRAGRQHQPRKKRCSLRWQS